MHVQYIIYIFLIFCVALLLLSLFFFYPIAGVGEPVQCPYAQGPSPLLTFAVGGCVIVEPNLIASGIVACFWKKIMTMAKAAATCGGLG